MIYKYMKTMGLTGRRVSVIHSWLSIVVFFLPLTYIFSAQQGQTILTFFLNP